MTTGFDAGSLARHYAFLDDCPTHLLDQVVTFPDGSLPERVAGMRQWRDALLAGRLPPSAAWPPESVAGPVRRALSALGLARFCKDQPDLVDALLTDLLAAFARQATELRSEVANCLRELEALERRRLSDEEEARARAERRAVQAVCLDDATLHHLQEQSRREVMARVCDADGRVVAAWEERVRVWTEIADVFGDLGQIMGRGWDLSLGILRHAGWSDLLRLRELVAQLPQVREIVRTLGRIHAADQEISVAERVLAPVRRVAEERREVRTPHVPAEARGVERSGELARMLPVEAAMLGHPTLRLLWHARRAERALLTYRVEGVTTERVWAERDSPADVQQSPPRPERGPILAVIDTSGSMHGLPEQVAKALVLEALRTANAEKRRCILYAYSGPGQILEHELDLAPEGLGRLLAFLGVSFGGGNDETGVLARVLARLKELDWQKADVVLISDGEWLPPASLVAEVHAARGGGTRFHGVQIGNQGHTGLHAICEPVHLFRDWAGAGGWR